MISLQKRSTSSFFLQRKQNEEDKGDPRQGYKTKSKTETLTQQFYIYRRDISDKLKRKEFIVKTI